MTPILTGKDPKGKLDGTIMTREEAQEEHWKRTRRREAMLKLHFRDLPLEEQLRLLRELVGRMELDALQQGLTIPPSPVVDRQPSPHPVVPDAPESPTATSPVGKGSGKPAFTDTELLPDPEWDRFDADMDELFRQGGDWHQIHSLRLKDAADRYRVLLERAGMLPARKGFADLARETRKAPLPAGTPPEWAEWVGKDPPAPDIPTSRDWADWLFPGTDTDDPDSDGTA